MSGLLHYLGAWVVVLVDAVAKAHQTEAGSLVLCLLDVLRDAIDAADFLQHVESGFVGTTVGGTPKASDAGGNAREWVCA